MVEMRSHVLSDQSTAPVWYWQRTCPRALPAIRTAQATALDRACALADAAAPAGDGTLAPVDIDATIVTAHSKENAAL